MKQYFSVVPVWAFFVMNIILGLLASGPLLIVMILMVGLVSPSKAMERIEGALVLAAVVLVFVAANHLLYRLLKRKKGKVCQTDNRKLFLRLFFRCRNRRNSGALYFSGNLAVSKRQVVLNVEST